MPDFNDLTLLPFCVGLTLLGLIASWAAWRRRGLAAGTRGVAWSLLPVSLYLTGLLKLLWDVLKSVTTWFAHLIFSPTVWAGVALFGVSVVLYVVSGVARSRRGDAPVSKSDAKPAANKPASASQAIGELTATGPAPASAKPAKPGKASKAAKKESSEFDEIEDILKRHGIN